MATPSLDADHQSLQFFFPRVAFPWIIFDMDGTLVNSFRLIVESFNRAGDGFMKKPLTIEEAQSIPGGSLEEQLANYVPRNLVPEAVERYHDHYVEHFDDEDIVYPGIRTLLTTLHDRGVKLAVYTGADKESAYYTLSCSRLSRFFQTIVTGNDVIRPKPDPEGLAITMKAIDAHPAQTVYLGDHPNDVKASRATGIKSAAACWGSKHLHELESLNPEFSFNDPIDALSGFLRPQADHD
jgi:pyrophosphatase PpaX